MIWFNKEFDGICKIIRGHQFRVFFNFRRCIAMSGFIIVRIRIQFKQLCKFILSKQHFSDFSRNTLSRVRRVLRTLPLHAKNAPSHTGLNVILPSIGRHSVCICRLFNLEFPEACRVASRTRICLSKLGWDGVQGRPNGACDRQRKPRSCADRRA